MLMMVVVVVVVVVVGKGYSGGRGGAIDHDVILSPPDSASNHTALNEGLAAGGAGRGGAGPHLLYHLRL